MFRSCSEDFSTEKQGTISEPTHSCRDAHRPTGRLKDERKDTERSALHSGVICIFCIEKQPNWLENYCRFERGTRGSHLRGLHRGWWDGVGCMWRGGRAAAEHMMHVCGGGIKRCRCNVVNAAVVCCGRRKHFNAYS